MNTTEQHLKRIQEKLQQLLKHHAALQKENLLLKEELSNSKKNATQYQENAEYLKQQVEILKLSNGEMDEEEKKQFEKRINAYLKEIDKCITLLSE